jgi:hypothetical protein
MVSHFAKGVYNIGTERKTIYELAKKRNSSVRKMSKNEITNVSLPSDISMNIDKYKEFYRTHTVSGG